MPKKSPSSVTPRAVGVVVLVMAAIAGALVATVGGQPRRLPRRSAGRRGNRLGLGRRIVDSRAPGSRLRPDREPAVHHDTSAPLRTLKPVVYPPAARSTRPTPRVGARSGTGKGGADPVVQSKVGARRRRPRSPTSRVSVSDRAGARPIRRPTRTARSARTTTSRSSTPTSRSSRRPARCSTGRSPTQHALERVRRRLPGQQRRRRHRRVRPVRRTAGSSSSSRSARRRTSSASRSRTTSDPTGS